MQNYKELKVWEKSHYLTLKIYEMTKAFPKDEQFGLVSQMRRASSSIPSNIAEGCGKLTQLDFAKYLNIALGSANEVDYFLILCKDLNYIDQNRFEELEKFINEIRAMLIVLIKKVRGSIT